MRKNRRNANRIVIQKMLDYCNDIESYINQVNASCETYSSNGIYVENFNGRYSRIEIAVGKNSCGGSGIK